MTTRRAASAGHRGRQSLPSGELKQAHQSSDSTLNDIADGDEFLLHHHHHHHQTYGMDGQQTQVQASQSRRQRHMSDFHMAYQSHGESVAAAAAVVQEQEQARLSDPNENGQQEQRRQSEEQCTATITDYSPEWCYPEGMCTLERTERGLISASLLQIP